MGRSDAFMQWIFENKNMHGIYQINFGLNTVSHISVVHIAFQLKLRIAMLTSWSKFKYAFTFTKSVSHQPTKDGMATKTMFKDWKKWKKI